MNLFFILKQAYKYQQEVAENNKINKILIKRLKIGN